MISEAKPAGSVPPLHVVQTEPLKATPKQLPEKRSQDRAVIDDNANKTDLNTLLSTPQGRESFKKSVEELNKYIKIFNSKMVFSFDENTGKTVITIRNKETEEVIRRIPPEELLKFSAKFREVIGNILDETV